jgi:hypothetical protein
VTVEAGRPERKDRAAQMQGVIMSRECRPPNKLEHAEEGDRMRCSRGRRSSKLELKVLRKSIEAEACMRM